MGTELTSGRRLRARTGPRGAGGTGAGDSCPALGGWKAKTALLAQQPGATVAGQAWKSGCTFLCSMDELLSIACEGNPHRKHTAPALPTGWGI